MPGKTNIEILIDKLNEQGFVLKKSKNESYYFHLNGEEEIKLIEIESDGYILHLIRIDKEGVFSYLPGFKYIYFDKEFDINRIVWLKEKKCSLSYSWQFRKAVNLPDYVEKLRINKKYKQKRINQKSKSLTISPDKLKLILNQISKAATKAGKYKNSVMNYLLNELTESYSSKKIRDTTSITEGEFNFLVHRLNLKTKANQKDFLKFLNNDDISSLQDLTIQLIKNNVFSNDFLFKLNNFFKKENLKDVIKKGEDILSLGVTDLTTEKAKEIVATITDKEILKLEGLWQEYFEKYLLFLIFSYKAVYPKVQLKNIDGDEKYPDFIGVNHYNGLDIIEIKTHLKHAITYDKSHDNYSFSGELSKAIIQTTNYMDQIVLGNFSKQSEKSKITKFSHKENLYRPRGIIIISSYKHLANKIDASNRNKAFRDFTKLRNSLHNIEILTFDEILNTANDYLKNVI